MEEIIELAAKQYGITPEEILDDRNREAQSGRIPDKEAHGGDKPGDWRADGRRELFGCIGSGGAYGERDGREQEHEKRHQPHGRKSATGQG